MNKGFPIFLIGYAHGSLVAFAISLADVMFDYNYNRFKNIKEPTLLVIKQTFFFPVLIPLYMYKNWNKFEK